MIDKNIRRFVLPCIFLAFPLFNWADVAVLQVLVQDAQKRPVRGVEIGVEGSGGSRITGDDGKALLPLAKETSENDWVSLQIVHSPRGQDWAMVSPYDGRTPVPSFKAKSENFVRVTVIERGDMAALQNGTVLASLTAKINKATTTPTRGGKQEREEDPKATLEAVAKQYGLKPEELDAAIRNWGAKTDDPYQAGLAALYARRYDEASARLEDSVQQRERQFARDQEKVAGESKGRGRCRMFLGIFTVPTGALATFSGVLSSMCRPQAR